MCLAVYFSSDDVATLSSISSKIRQNFTIYFNIDLLHVQSIVWQFVLIGLISNIVSATLHAILIFAANLGFL